MSLPVSSQVARTANLAASAAPEPPLLPARPHMILCAELYASLHVCPHACETLAGLYQLLCPVIPEYMWFSTAYLQSGSGRYED